MTYKTSESGFGAWILHGLRVFHITSRSKLESGHRESVAGVYGLGVYG